MTTAITRLLRSFFWNEDGWVSPHNLLMSVALMIFGGVSYEYADVVRQKTYLQNATDAVALAALQQLPDQQAALTSGLAVAAKYFPDEETLATITSEDVVFGTWDTEELVFTEGTESTTATAVRVIASNTSDRGTQDPSAFRGFTRNLGYDVLAVSIAGATSSTYNPCTNGGLLSGSWFNSNTNNVYSDGFCTYGELGLDIGNNNSYASNDTIQGGRNATFLQGNSNVCEGDTCSMNVPGPSDPDTVLNLPSQTTPLYNSLSTGDTSVVVDGHLYTVRYVSKMPRRRFVVPYSLYIVSGDAEFSSNGTYENLIVAASGDIKAGSNTSFEDIVFVTNNNITFGANTDFGSDDYCLEGRYQVYLFSGGDITMGSNNDLHAMQMAAGGAINFNSNVRGIGDIHGEALGDIDYNSNNNMNDCGTGLTSDFDWAPEIQVTISDGDSGLVL